MERKYIPGEDYDAYDVDLMHKMYEKRIGGLPIAFTLLDMRKTDTHCHETADMLVLLLEDGKRVTGELPNIVGKDKRHSWVECGDFCYDTTEGMKWKKSSYYEANLPQNIVVHSREESLQNMQNHLNLPECPKEKYVAFVRDLESNVSSQLYRAFLRLYIRKFKEEKGLDIQDYDEEKVQSYLKKIERFYAQINKGISKTVVDFEDEEPGNR